MKNLLFITYSDEGWLYYQFSPAHLYISLLEGWENELFERIKPHQRTENLPSVCTLNLVCLIQHMFGSTQIIRQPQSLKFICRVRKLGTLIPPLNTTQIVCRIQRISSIEWETKWLLAKMFCPLFDDGREGDGGTLEMVHKINFPNPKSRLR